MDDLHDQIEKYHWGQKWEGHMPELNPFVCPIHRSSFVKLCWDILKACQKQHHRGTKLPYNQKADGYKGNIRIAQPVHCRNMQHSQKLVDHSVLHKHKSP